MCVIVIVTVAKQDNRMCLTKAITHGKFRKHRVQWGCADGTRGLDNENVGLLEKHFCTMVCARSFATMGGLEVAWYHCNGKFVRAAVLGVTAAEGGAEFIQK